MSRVRAGLFERIVRVAVLAMGTGVTALLAGGAATSASAESADRIARIVLGLVLIALVFIGPKTPWGWIGVVPLVTGFLRTGA